MNSSTLPSGRDPGGEYSGEVTETLSQYTDAGVCVSRIDEGDKGNSDRVSLKTTTSLLLSRLKRGAGREESLNFGVAAVDAVAGSEIGSSPLMESSNYRLGARIQIE